jgi:cysteine desulfurase
VLVTAVSSAWAHAGGPAAGAPRAPTYNRRLMAIYLDHAATTPLRPEALEAMLPFLGATFGNASSAHSFGRAARAALDEAHERIAARVGAGPREIVLTSGGTEANNLALKGAAWAGKARGHRIVTTGVEHHSVGHALAYLEKSGFEVVTLPVDRYGRVDPDEVEAALTDKAILVSVMLANNEVGTVQPVAEIGRRVHAHRGVLFHVDAVQAAPYLPIDVTDLDVDLLSLSAHKFEGPKGVGALYVRRGTHILAQQQGGSQERYRRAGTEDVAGAVGMAEALDRSVGERPETAIRLARLRDRLAAATLSVDGVELSGHPRDRLPGLLSIVIRDADGPSLAFALDLEGIAVSTGSACTTGSDEVSHVLTAMGYPEDEARGALRLSLGRTTIEADVDAVIATVPRIIAAHRAAGASMAGATGYVPADAAGRV